MSKYPNRNPGIVRTDCLINGSISKDYPPQPARGRPMTAEERAEWDYEMEQWRQRCDEANNRAEDRFRATGSYVIDARKK